MNTCLQNMKTYFNKLVIAISATFLLAGCNTEDPQPSNQSRYAFLKKVTTSTGDSREFTYTPQGIMEGVKGTGGLALNENATSESKIFYDNRGRIAYVLTDGPNIDTENVYHYTAEGIFYKLEELINNKVESYHTFEYEDVNGAKRLKTQYAFYKDISFANALRETNKNTYTYDVNGNVSEVTLYRKPTATADWQLVHTIKYENYDNKIGVQHLTTGYLFTPNIRLQKNNPGKVTITLASGDQRITTHTYQYNEQNLPVKQFSTPSNASPFEREYTYHF